MAIYAVQAYAYAATFKLPALLPLFHGVEARVDKDRLLARFGEHAYALAYDFGAVVFFGVEAPDRNRVVAALAKLLTEEPHAPLTESFLVEVDEGGIGPSGWLEVHFDRVVVGRLTLPIVDIVALVLAQSAEVDYYAQDVEEIEAETDRIVGQLRSQGRIRRVRELSRFIGLCMATRNDVLSTLALFDKPESTWENEQLDRLWNGLYHMLELGDRYRALDVKLRMFQDNLVVLVDLARQRHTLALETTVAVLILLEILAMIWQIVITVHR